MISFKARPMTGTRASQDLLIDARQAADVTQLPIHYFASKAKRKQLQMPHYRIGSMVRFKLAEIFEWQEQQTFIACSKKGLDA